MVVHDLHGGGSGGGPPKTDPPLVVDPNAVLSEAIALERLQSILWGRGQIAKLMGAIEHLELPRGYPFDIREPRHADSGEQPLRPGVREGDNHAGIV